MKVNEPGKGFFLFLPGTDHIYKSLGELELRCLKPIGELLFYGPFNNPGSCKAYEGPGLGNGHIPQHGEGGCNTPGDGIAEYHKQGQAGIIQLRR